jgi:hypothetical protein
LTVAVFVQSDGVITDAFVDYKVPLPVFGTAGTDECKLNSGGDDLFLEVKFETEVLCGGEGGGGEQSVH